MHCPVCKTTELNMSDRQGIEIDYCPQCRGVWLDRGELDKIIERTVMEQKNMLNQPSSRLGDEDRHREYDRDDRPRRKKSFLEDLFD